jgi:hypothetical protein
MLSNIHLHVADHRGCDDLSRDPDTVPAVLLKPEAECNDHYRFAYQHDFGYVRNNSVAIDDIKCEF